MLKKEYNILIISDNAQQISTYKEYLSDKMQKIKFVTKSHKNDDKNFQYCRQTNPHCLLIDYDHSENQIQLIKKVKKYNQFLSIIAIIDNDDEKSATKLVAIGVQNYIAKRNLDKNTLYKTIIFALNSKSLMAKIYQEKIKTKLAYKELESFTYVVSHDMRSPLVNIKGFSIELESAFKKVNSILQTQFGKLDIDQQIQVKRLFERIPQSISFIKKGAEKLDSMTNQMLKLSRIGRYHLNIQPLDVKQIIQDYTDVISQTVENQNIIIKIGDIPNINGDAVAVSQIFANIIDNSIKYSHPDRQCIIKIDGKIVKNEVAYSIQDNGRGIKKGDEESVFTIFKRTGDNSSIPGEGIGLPYTKTIIEKHMGKIWFESKENHGTSFYFTIANNLPISKADKSDPENKAIENL